MTLDEAIKRIKEKMACDYNISGCDTCNISSCEDRDIVIQLAEWPEELKSIKIDGFTDDLLNMGFTKGYNKAIDDFVNVCEKQFTTMYGQRYVDMRDIVNIAEQLKAGGKNEL